jgi:hypothetical protein
MEIKTVDGKILDTNKFSDAKALLIEKIHSLGEESKAISNGYMFFGKNLDGTSFSSFHVEKDKAADFWDSLACFLFSVTNGRIGLFCSHLDECGERKSFLILPKEMP